MPGKLKVLFVSAECEPYARTGGLGDVSSALPDALMDENVIVKRVMPLYRNVKEDMKYKCNFKVQMGERYQDCIVEFDPSSKVPTYFIGSSFYFDRENMYGYYEDGERFLFFCKAAIEMLKYINFKPDIIHCNDWHTAMIPLILKSSGSPIKTVYTIHNLRFTGSIPPDYLNEFEIYREGIEKTGYPDNIDFMKAGLMYSHKITTVSKRYAGEILTPEFGEGLEGFLSGRKDDITGILNGIDTNAFSPLNSPVPFDAQSVELKEKNKEVLREELGLDKNDLPVVSVVTRLDEQKGIDLILSAINKMDMQGFQFVILGTGNKYYEEMFGEMASMYTGRMAAIFKFDTGLSKRIYAGSDILLMPSKFEPCGLSQQYALSYGTVPVVSNTGGLADTVWDLKNGIERANGFTFDSFTVGSFIDALGRAVKTYNEKGLWKKLMLNGMSQDRSWKQPALQYIDVYKSINE
jgi:glycogen/starch synthases, ADP-glucose type